MGAEIAMLEKRQALEEFCLELEAEMARISKGESPCCDEHPIFTAAMASQIGTAVQ